jgi:hypothetical protein
MFHRHAKATRLAAAYLLFTVALMIVPKADIPETLFDEANTPTNSRAPGAGIEGKRLGVSTWPAGVVQVNLHVYGKTTFN